MPTKAYRRQACPILSAEDCEMEAPLMHWYRSAKASHPHILHGGLLVTALSSAVREFDPFAGYLSMGVQPNNKPATPEDFARVWNLAMALLGFTEGNPEA